jgi:hypothetical protein
VIANTPSTTNSQQAPQNPASTTPKTTAEPSLTDEQPTEPTSESQPPGKYLGKRLSLVPSDDVDVMSQHSYSLTVHVS